MSEKKVSKSKPRGTAKKPINPKGGIVISSGRDTNISGDITEGNKTELNVSTPRSNEIKNPQGTLPPPPNSVVVQSAWANGLFYLFAFVLVVGVIAWLSGNLDSAKLGLVILTGIFAVILIGTFQLRMDKRLSEKTFVELIKLTVSQLPIIKNSFKGKT